METEKKVWPCFWDPKGSPWAWNDARNWRDHLAPEDGDIADLGGRIMPVHHDDASVVG